MPTKLLHDNLWKEISRLASKAQRRRAAIAYVTKDLIGFKEGDLLVTDASPLSIRKSSTSAALLRELFDKGVELRSCPTLHAKMLVFGNQAFVGSANLSETSRDRLNEAGVLTDSPGIFNDVTAMILRLADASKPITESVLAKLEAIVPEPVARRTAVQSEPIAVGKALGNTWIICLHEEAPDKGSKEEARLERAMDKAKALKTNKRSHPDAFWYDLVNGFPKKVRTGDRLITCWSESEEGGPTSVYRNSVVRNVERDSKHAYVSTEDLPGWRKDALTWKRFLRVIGQCGIKRKDFSTGLLVKPQVAALIDEHWISKR